MALVPMKKLLDDAVARNGAFGAFSVANMEMVDGTVRAAEEMQTDIVLQMDESWFPAVPFRLMAPMMIRAAKEAKVNIAVHLDHGQSPRLIRKALKEGFTSVMFDGSTMPFRGNILRTREVVAAAGKYGATVEAELGQIGNNDGRTSSAHRLKLTDPMDALQFVQRTGVEIGRAHV